MNIALCLNKKYIPYATVTMISIYIHETCDLDFYLVSGDLDDGDLGKIKESLEYAKEHLNADLRKMLSAVDELPKVRVHLVRADASLLPDEAPVTKNWTAEIYFRLMFTEILPEDIDRILYLDCDMVVVHSLSGLYNIDLNGNLLCACAGANQDTDHMSPMQRKMLMPLFSEGHRYFNSGTLLFDMDGMRQKHSFSDYLKALKDWDYQVSAPDQDLLNYVNYDETKVIDWKQYNFYAKNAATKGVTSDNIYDTDISVVHFPGPKPWNNAGDHYEAELIWWDIAELYDGYERLLYDFMHSALTDTRLSDFIKKITSSWESTQNENQMLRSQNAELQAMCKRMAEMIENLSGES